MVSSNQLKGVDNLATTKTITMKQFNGTDYDTLYPKTKVEQVEGAYTQQQILADLTKTILGLDENAVPDDAFTSLKNLIDSNYSELSSLANSKAKIVAGSYVGTGAYGASNPCRLTFNFIPLLVVVQTKEYSVGYATSATLVIVPQSKQAWAFGNFQNKVVYNVISLSGNTLSWYSESNEFNQLNIKGRVYCYTAVG